MGCLLQIADTKVIPKDNLPFVGLICSAQDVEERALARAVLGNEADLLPLADTEAEVAEKRLVPYTTRQILYL